MTAPDSPLVDVIAAALEAHAPIIVYYSAEEGHVSCHGCDGNWASFDGFYAHQACAVLAALSEAGAVEWGVAGPNGYVNEYETEADARLQIATRNYLTLWNRIAATDWQRAE